MASENITERVTDALVVAVRPAAVPVGTFPPESPKTPLILPVLVPAAVVRDFVFSGSVQVRSVDDFSVQMLTSQEFCSAIGTDGVV
jgi:hypothetical protein